MLHYTEFLNGRPTNLINTWFLVYLFQKVDFLNTVCGAFYVHS